MSGLESLDLDALRCVVMAGVEAGRVCALLEGTCRSLRTALQACVPSVVWKELLLRDFPYMVGVFRREPPRASTVYRELYRRQWLAQYEPRLGPPSGGGEYVIVVELRDYSDPDAPVLRWDAPLQEATAFNSKTYAARTWANVDALYKRVRRPVASQAPAELRVHIWVTRRSDYTTLYLMAARATSSSCILTDRASFVGCQSHGPLYPHLRCRHWIADVQVQFRPTAGLAAAPQDLHLLLWRNCSSSSARLTDFVRQLRRAEWRT